MNDRSEAWLARLAAVEDRLVAAAGRTHRGLTRPDPDGTERWSAGQVWAHVAEFGSYWLDELDLILDADGPVTFGRTKADPDRRAAVAAADDRPVTEHLSIARADMAALRSRLGSMTAEGWDHKGTHATLGVMTIDEFMSHFLVGHYEEHADQLDDLASD